MAGTRVVTLLFTDLVSSTALSQQLGEDAAEALRRTHFRLLREAISTHHGDEVKNLGDGLMVVFDSPSDAAACAVAMQQALDHHNQRHPHRLELRVGVHTGEVTQEDDDYFGTAVVVAERLCKCAESGQVVASDVLRLMVGSRGGHTFRELGPVELKGIPEPVGAVEIGWEPAAPDALPLPHPLSGIDTNPYVGRDEERQKLWDAYKLAIAGERHLTFLVGEPGIGKSRLCAELARLAHSDGATVLYGRCDEDSLAPFQPFVEALRHYVLVCPLEDLRAQARPVAGDLVRLVPDLARRLPDVTAASPGNDPDADRLRLFDAAHSLLAEASSERTIVLVLDDLHWADRPTLQLLRHLLRAAPFPILLVCTYRETDLDRTHPLSAALADLRREHPFERLHLKGLDTEEIFLALERSAGHPVGHRGHDLAEALARTTDGNPFFIQQILGHLADTGRIYQQDGVWTFDAGIEDLGIPEGVKEVIGRRISALSDAANRALGIASVLGRDFELEVLERVSEMDGDELVDALDASVAAGIVVEAGAAGRYSFAHALVRETLYEELTATRRVRLHRRAAGVFEELAGGDPDRFVSELAHHFLEAAQVTEVDKAIDYATRAARQAVEVLAYEEGVRLYERALGALELGESTDEILRFELTVGLGDALGKAGEFDASRETFLRAVEIARSIGDRERLARAALGLAGPPESFTPVDVPVRDTLEEAFAAVEDTEPITAARITARLAAHLLADQTQAERRAELARQALDMARATDDLRTVAFALRCANIALWEPTNVDGELEASAEILRVAEEAGDRELIAFGHQWRFIMLLWAGDVDGADEAAAIVAELAHELKQPFLGWLAVVARACRLAASGYLEDAEAIANEAFAMGQRAVPNAAMPAYGVQLVAIRWPQGRVAELEPIVRAQVESNPEIPAWRCSLAYICSEAGREDETRAEFELLAKEDFLLPRDAAWPIGMARLALTCAFLGDEARARTLYDLFAPYAGRNVVVGPGFSSAGAASRYLALLAATMGRWDDAERHFEQALEMNERMGARPFVAFTANEYAEMLRRRGRPGDAERAQDLDRRALHIAREVGMPLVEARIEAAIG